MSLLKELPKRKWVKGGDKSFLTAQEIMDETGESLTWAQRYMRARIRSGEWEVRWKRVNGRPVMAAGHD